MPLCWPPWAASGTSFRGLRSPSAVRLMRVCSQSRVLEWLGPRMRPMQLSSCASGAASLDTWRCD